MFTKKYINKIGSKIKQGSLRVVFPNNEEFLFKGRDGLHGELILKSYKPIFRTVVGGHLGFAESYLKNEWDSPNLENLLELMLQNLPNEFKAKSSLYKTYNRFIHFLRDAICFNPDFVASHGLRPILVADFVRISKARIKIIEIDTLLNRS